MFSLVLLAAFASAKDITIGYMEDGPIVDEAFVETWKSETLGLLSDEFTVELVALPFAVGADQDPLAAMNTARARSDLNMVVALGPVGSYAAFRSEGPKPVVASFVLPGVATDNPSVASVSVPSTLEHDISFLHELTDGDRFAVLFPKAVSASTDVDAILKAAGETPDVEVVPWVGSPYAEATITAKPDDIDGVVIGSLAGMAMEEQDELLRSLREGRVPTYISYDTDMVERGALAGTGSVSTDRQIARRSALNIQQILLGRRPGTLDSTVNAANRTVINLTVAGETGVDIPWSMLTQVETTHTIGSAEVWTLQSVILRAMEANRDVLAGRANVDASRASLGVTRGPLLPQGGVGFSGNLRDKDRADASDGLIPQYDLRFSANLRQSLYSESDWTDFRTQKFDQRAVEAGQETLEADIAQAAAETWLRALQRLAAEEVAKENLELARKNLALAETRVNVGLAGANELHRWDYEIERARTTLMDAYNDRRASELALARLLDLPQRSDLELEDPGEEDVLLGPNGEMRRVLERTGTFSRAADQFVMVALENSPELKQLSEQYTAQQKSKGGNTRAYFIPEIALTGSLDQLLLRDNAASTPANLNNTFWNVGVAVDFPILNGGSRSEEVKRSNYAMAQIDAQSAAQRNQIEELTRQELQAAVRSLHNLARSRAATDAARANLDYVTENYKTGQVSILNLLDAQEALIAAREGETNAKYRCFRDLVGVARSVNYFWFMEDEGEQTEWFADILNPPESAE